MRLFHVFFCSPNAKSWRIPKQRYQLAGLKECQGHKHVYSLTTQHLPAQFPPFLFCHRTPFTVMTPSTGLHRSLELTRSHCHTYDEQILVDVFLTRLEKPVSDGGVMAIKLFFSEHKSRVLNLAQKALLTSSLLPSCLSGLSSVISCAYPLPPPAHRSPCLSSSTLTGCLTCPQTLSREPCDFLPHFLRVLPNATLSEVSLVIPSWSLTDFLSFFIFQHLSLSDIFICLGVYYLSLPQIFFN